MNFYSKRGRLKRVLATLVGIGLTGMPALAASPGGVSSGLTEWFDAGSGVTGSSGSLSWSRKGYDSSVATPSAATLTELLEAGVSGTSAPITLVPGIVNFNAGFRFGNKSYFGSKTGAAETLFSQAGITTATTGSGFGVGYTSDQLLTNALGSSLTSTCGTDRCDVGTRTSATQFGGGSQLFSGNTGYNLFSTDGPTANLYGFWASATTTGILSSHTNTRNGMTNTGPAVPKVTNANYVFRIGSFPGSNYFNSTAGSTGAITEGIYYNRELTATEAQKVSSYLAIKYGITLDTNILRNDILGNYDYINSSGTTVWSGTNGTFSPYHNNVFGIGRDVNSALNQMISTSVNNGGAVGTFALDILTLANGSSVGSTGPSAFNYLVQTDSTGQAAGTGTSLNDGQFLMIGNNAGSTTTTTSASVGSATNTLINGTWTRLDRRWIAQNTGSVGNVSLNFNLPVAAVTALGNNLKNVVLLVDNDGNYANGGTRVITNRVISGNQISFNTTLSNSEVFTVAFTTPTVTIKKTTVGVATGSSNTFNFNITATNTATSTTTNTYTPAVAVTGSTTTTGTANNIDFNTDVSVSETIPSGFGLSALVCTNATAGGPAFTPTYNLATGTATIPAAMISADAAITCAFTNALKMDLSITKNVDYSTYIPGQVLTYTIVASNVGSSDTANAVFNDPAVTGLNVYSVVCGSATGGATCPTAGNTTVAAMQGAGIAIPSLPSGGSVTFTLDTGVQDGTMGNLSNTATINVPSGAIELNPANNTSSATSTIELPTITCTPNTIYGLDDARHLVAINTTTASSSLVTTFPAPSGNALGLTSGGNSAYMVANLDVAGPISIVRWDALTGFFTTYNGGNLVNAVDNDVIPRGAVNLTNGIYYYSRTRTGTDLQDIYAFNTNTNTSIGLVGTLSGRSGGSGDLAFDRAGNMLILISDTSTGIHDLVLVKNVPTTAGTVALTGTLLANLPAPSTIYNSIAFGADGLLYVATSSTLYRVNPNNGVVLNSSSMTESLVDLASCGTPGTLTLQKSITARSNTTDQFTLTISGATSGNTATTTGTSSGLQSALAGPIVGISGASYTISETASGTTNLADYTTTWQCLNDAGTTIASGTGTTGTFTFPSLSGATGAQINCTFTNTKPMFPFVCTSSKVFVSADGAAGTTQLSALNYGASGAGTLSSIGSASSAVYNGIGFNPTDNYLYGFISGSPGPAHLVKIDSTGNVAILGTLSGYPSANVRAGAFNAAGEFFIYDENFGDAIYKVNLTTAVATKITLSQNLITGTVYQVADIAFIGNYIYSYSNLAGSGKNIIRIDPTTGTVNIFPFSADSVTTSYGVLWAYGNGDLGLLSGSGNLALQIKITNPNSATPTFTTIGTRTAPTATGTDGANCSVPVDVRVNKTATGGAVAGGLITWNVTVTNNELAGGPSSSGFTLVDTVPSGVTSITASAAGCVVSGSNISCQGGALAPQGSITYTFTGNAPNPFNACIVNTVTVTGLESDPVASNNTSSANTCPPANLAITKSDSVSTYTPNQALTYSIVVSNIGSTSTTNAIFADPAVTGLTVSSVTCGSITGGAICPTVANTTVALMQGTGIVIPLLPNGSSMTFTVNTTVNAGRTGNLSNIATIAMPSGATDSNLANNTATDTNTSTIVSDLSLVKTGPTVVQPNSSITYTLTVTNSNSAAVPTTTLTDTLPAGTTFVSASDSGTHSAGTVTWNLGTVAANTTKAVTVTITSPDLTAVKAGNKTLINTATVSAPSDSNAANNTSSVTTQIAAIELIKQVRNVSTGNAFASINSGLPSQTLEYCIDFYNRGNAQLINFILTDNVPANITALLTGYDADEPSATTGFGVKLVRSATTYLSSATDADLGSLNTTGGTFANGLLTVNLGVLAIAETGQTCFKGTVR